MKKIFYLVALVAISLLFVQCEQNGMGSASGRHKGREYVDLGLSVKWATCNVGANSPDEYGNYFAWGEVEPKEYYYWDTYKYTTIEDALIKYNNSDNKIVLDPEDDAATVNWGGLWRMPTDTEFTELIKQCTWTWTTQAGVNGYKVVGKNGKSIFLPAPRSSVNIISGNRSSSGDYWSSSLYTDDPGYAYAVYFDSSEVSRYDYDRYYGLSVRPVCQ